MGNHVLLVEDDPPSIDIMQRELKLLGYEVILARNGAEAVEIADSQLPSLIVMDMLMPKMDGFEATAQIRNNPKTHSIPIIAATAKALRGDKEKCLAAGCDAYISKPFTYKQLGAAIEKVLKEKSQPTP